MIFEDASPPPAKMSIARGPSERPLVHRNAQGERLLRLLLATPGLLEIETEPVELLLGNGPHQVLYAPTAITTWLPQRRQPWSSRDRPDDRDVIVFEAVSERQLASRRDSAILKVVQSHFLSRGQQFRIVTEADLADMSRKLEILLSAAPAPPATCIAIVRAALRTSSGGGVDVTTLEARATRLGLRWKEFAPTVAWMISSGLLRNAPNGPITGTTRMDVLND